MPETHAVPYDRSAQCATSVLAHAAEGGRLGMESGFDDTTRSFRTESIAAATRPASQRRYRHVRQQSPQSDRPGVKRCVRQIMSNITYSVRIYEAVTWVNPGLFNKTVVARSCLDSTNWGSLYRYIFRQLIDFERQ